MFLSIDIGVCCMCLNELTTRTDFVAHKHRENSVGLAGVFYRHLLYGSAVRVHSGFPKLVVVHFTKTFVSLNLQARLAALAHLVLA